MVMTVMNAVASVTVDHRMRTLVLLPQLVHASIVPAFFVPPMPPVPTASTCLSPLPSQKSFSPLIILCRPAPCYGNEQVVPGHGIPIIPTKRTQSMKTLLSPEYLEL